MFFEQQWALKGWKEKVFPHQNFIFLSRWMVGWKLWIFLFYFSSLKLWTPQPQQFPQGGFFQVSWKTQMRKRKISEIFLIFGLRFSRFLLFFGCYTLYNFESISCRINRRVSFLKISFCALSPTYTTHMIRNHTVANCFSSYPLSFSLTSNRLYYVWVKRQK